MQSHDNTTLEILAEYGHFPVKEQPHRPKDAHLFLCPFHADTEPSLSIHADGCRWKCLAGCEQGGPAKMRQMLEGGVTPRIPKAPKPTNKVKKPREPLKGCTLEEISSAKNLPLPFLLSLGWRDSRYAGVPAVAVPWPGGIHYRVNLDANPKYLWRKGDKVSILGIERLEEVRRIGWVLFVEGDTDYAAGRLMGLPVMAVPGASTWKADWALQFQGCQIYVWKEPDSGGENLVGKLAESFWDIKIIEAPPGIKDLAELYSQAGAGAREFFDDLKAEAQSFRQVRQEENVTSIVKDIPKDSYNYRGDKSALRKYAAELFPPPPGVKAWGKVHLLTNDAGDTLLGAFLRSPSWRNPVNAADKIQAAYVNLMKYLTGVELYEITIPADDWNLKKRRALGRRILRAGARAVHFDNLLALGYVRYLVDKPLKGAMPVVDLEDTLISALRGIRPPKRGEGAGRFHPIDGTPEWVDGLYEDPEKDRGKWHAVAVASSQAHDLVDLEIVAVSEGLRYEWVRSYWRLQQGPGILIYGMPVADWLKILESLGYVPTRLGRDLLKETICV